MSSAASDPWADIVPGNPSRTLAAVHEQPPVPTGEEVSYDYAVLLPSGELETHYDTFPSGKAPHTAESAASHAKMDGGTVRQREVVRGPWLAYRPGPATRTLSSPASPGQRKFVADLLLDRVVPEPLRRRVEACRETMTDGDARELIPLLKNCPKPFRGDDFYDHDPYDPGYNPGSQEHDV